MQRRYITVDVFTDRAFGGNPLAVVLDAGGLSTAQMQAIASEFNYAETTFVLPPRDLAHDAQVRIFTVTSEVPFAGHPNVGTAFVLAMQASRLPATSEVPFAGHPNVGTAFVLAMQASRLPARLKFEEGAGLVPVEILKEGGRIVGAELTAPHPLSRGMQVGAEQVAACGSLSAADIRTDRHPPVIVSVGMPFLVAELSSRDALRRARPDPGPFARTLPCEGAFAIYLYTRDIPPAEKPCDLQARMFFPGTSGLIEDPATGSAAVATAALLADLSGERDGESKLRIGQGFDLGRPSLLLTRVRKANGVVASAHVGGACVQMMEGSFRLIGEG